MSRVIILVSLILAVLSSWTLVYAQPTPTHAVGGELGFLTEPLGFDDPYSWSLGGRVSYELHRLPLSLPLSLGVGAGAYAHYPVEAGYADSFMLVGWVTAGYDFAIPVHNDFAVYVTPYLGYGHYYRELEFEGVRYHASRPMITVGATVDLYIQRHLLMGTRLGFQVLAENQPLVTVALSQRMGYRF